MIIIVLYVRIMHIFLSSCGYQVFFVLFFLIVLNQAQELYPGCHEIYNFKIVIHLYIVTT